MSIDRQSGYGDIHASSYDLLFGDRDDTERVAEVLHALADGGEALEFGVGTGRFAIPLARLGTRVHAVDNSTAMLDILRDKLGDEPVVPILGDFRDVRVDAPVSLVFCAFSTLFLMEDQAMQVDVMRNAAAHLEVGGRVLIETFVHDRTRFTNNQETVAVEVGVDSAIMRLTMLAPNEQVLRIQKFGMGVEGITVLPNRLRFVYPAELDLMARLAGLEREIRWRDWEQHEFTATSDNLIAVYRKVGDGPY